MKRLGRGLFAAAILASSVALMGMQCDNECDMPTVGTGDTYYNRFEAPSFDNDCAADAECVVGGCSGEVCAAEDVATTCDVLPYEPEGLCGCLDGKCLWHTHECAEAECSVDADCQKFSNYCDGCACDGIPAGSTPPACTGTIVACFMDPCQGKIAKCLAGQCTTINNPS